MKCILDRVASGRKTEMAFHSAMKTAGASYTKASPRLQQSAKRLQCWYGAILKTLAASRTLARNCTTYYSGAVCVPRLSLISCRGSSLHIGTCSCAAHTHIHTHTHTHTHHIQKLSSRSAYILHCKTHWLMAQTRDTHLQQEGKKGWGFTSLGSAS
jgi:hypothetical protein